MQSLITLFSFPNTFRLDAIAVDAELQEKSLSELERLAEILHESCVQAEAERMIRLVVQLYCL